MKYNGVILKKFVVMDDELALLKALGEMTTTRLDILSHHLDDLIVFRNEVTGAQ